MDGLIRKNIRLFADERGMVFEPVDGEALAAGHVRNFHLATMKTGVVRGNHWHKEQTETISVFGSSGLAKFRDMKSGAEENIIVEEGAVCTFTIAPGIAHAVINTGDKEMILACYTDRIHMPEKPDREIVTLIDSGE